MTMRGYGSVVLAIALAVACGGQSSNTGDAKADAKAGAKADAGKTGAGSKTDGGKTDGGKADGGGKPDGGQVDAGPRAAVVPATCSNTYPAYWQDPDPKYADMWHGQAISDQPPADWKGPVFRLSDAFPRQPVDDRGAQAWRDSKFDALFAAKTSQEDRTRLADEYIWAVMRYIQDGNIESGDVATDWTLCDNKVRNWYHMPYQTYDALSGREFVHGLTREAPVQFSLAAVNQDGSDVLATTMWAVGFFNPTAAHTLGRVWQADGTARLPTEDLRFDEGAVVGKLLFNTATPEQFPVLQNMPAWVANISATSFCNCKPAAGETTCTMIEQSQQCPRSTTTAPAVHLLQFDVSVRDSRAGGTGWVFGTFVADGQRKAAEKNPWNRISPLGLMWGNDQPPEGGLAIDAPPDPRKNGFSEEVIFWDTVDMLNAVGGSVVPRRPGHLGCNGRLNGPADNANSSCMSCHMTASVHDTDLVTPPIIAQFGGITPECVRPDAADPTTGTDASGSPAKVVDDVAFAAIDRLYFADTRAGTPVDMNASTAAGPVDVLGDAPKYADGRESWVSLDYSLQLSISLVQWSQWQDHVDDDAKAKTKRKFEGVLPGR